MRDRLRALLLTGSALAVGSANGGAALACTSPIVISGPGSSGGISNGGSADCTRPGGRCNFRHCRRPVG